ncbi:MAG: hypothetical protein PHV03_01860 [Desulfitobacteriaceae bacterium]|nr:hypothetical protein [Desulfitobacteriaceae bacterium]
MPTILIFWASELRMERNFLKTVFTAGPLTESILAIISGMLAAPKTPKEKEIPIKRNLLLNKLLKRVYYHKLSALNFLRR